MTTKPELSFARIGSLPSRLAKSYAASKVATLVVTVRTTSTSFISGTGLKKCRPTIRSGRVVAAAIAAIVRLDVFDAKIVCGGQSGIELLPDRVLDVEILDDRLDDDVAIVKVGDGRS